MLRGGWVMTFLDERTFEIIFDPIAKSAILRRDETLIWLDGPFRTYSEATEAARVHLEKLAGPFPPGDQFKR